MGLYNDSELIQLIQNGNREKAIAQIYQQVYPKIRSIILKKGGNIDDAKDLFQEAVLTLYLKIIEHKFGISETNIGGFIMQLAQNKWVDKIRKDHKLDFTENIKSENSSNSTPILNLLNKEKTELIDKILTPIGEKCKELLRLVIVHNHTMKEIAETLGLSGEDSAKTQHYKCKSKLIERYRTNTYVKELLKLSSHE